MDFEQILALKNVDAFYDHTEILHGISLNVEKGGNCGLVGRIGAGKTTTLKSILGLLRTSGSIMFKGKEITKLPTFKIINMGIGYVPEGRKLYGELTVNENLEIAREGSSSEEELSKIYDLFPELSDKKSNKAKFLSGGERQMLAVARGLAGIPELLLMDEPYEGLAVPVIRRLNEAFQEMKKSGVTLLVAEASLKNLELLADRILVIDRGRIIFSGEVEEVKQFISSHNLIL